MAEPDKQQEDQPETIADSSVPDSDSNVAPSTPGEDDTSSLTEIYLPKNKLEGVNDDSFDPEILADSSKADSLGKLGKYEVVELIGQGGMGVVLKGRDDSLGRYVAIKVLSRQLATSPTARRRFMREGRAVAAISHPNVITIHAVEEQGGLPFLVMEFADGGSLHERIKKESPLPLADVLRLGAQIAIGLAAAHAQGVIHRDIKPGNVMLEHQVDRVKITDFGLARVAMDNSDLTSQGNQPGTPAYMSPEQVQGHEVDDRSDLFSLGCVLYAMIAGQSPFRGAHAFDAARRILEHTPPPLTEINEEVPPFLSDIVSRLLEKDPRNRYQSAVKVGEVLNHYLSKLNQTRTDELHKLKEEPLKFKTPKRSRTRLAVGAVALLAVIMTAVVASPLWFSKRDKEQAANGDSGKGPDSSPSRDAVETNTTTVAKTGSAQFTTISDALAKAIPGTTIRVLDDAAYQESFLIDNSEKWSGVKIISDSKASIFGPPGKEGPVIAVRDTPGVVIKGLRIRPQSKQFGILITGNCEGVTLDSVEIKAEGKHWAQVYVKTKARGSQQQPIAIRNSRFEVHNIGVDIEGELKAGDCIANVQVKDNRFSGSGNHILLVQSVSDVQVSGNTFTGGKGIVCALLQPDASKSIQITNNSFFDNDEWLVLEQASPAVPDVTIRNNLVIGAAGIGIQRFPLDAFASQWNFSHNVWEPGEETDIVQIPLVAEQVGEVSLASRDPQHPDFLRPAEGSSLAGRGFGGELPDYVGAFEPSSVRERVPFEPAFFPLSSGSVDLLSRIDIENGFKVGESWRLADGRLITGTGRGARLQIPCSGLSSYELRIVATRRENQGPLVVGLVVGASQCYLLLDAHRVGEKRLTAFGLGPDDKLIETKEGFHLPMDEPIEIVCHVTPNSLQIDFGGKEAFRWQGNSRDLKLGAGWKVPNPESFFIGTNDDAVFEISRMQLAPFGDE